MATITAPADSSKDPSGRPASPPRPQLWQAPVFVLGVAALLGMGLSRPFAANNPSQQLAGDLAKAREILASPDGDVEYAMKLARRGLEAADQYSDFIGTAAFLLGTGQIRLAEKADDKSALEAWQHAMQYLEQAEKAGVTDPDHPMLVYRLGKVGFYTGDDLRRVISRLEESVERTDNPVEGYRLLTQAHLHLQPPDLAKALQYNDKLREQHDVSETELTEAQLRGGDLLLRLGKADEARKSLEKISKNASPAIVVRANLLQGRSYQEEKQWGNAARLYVNALADQRAPTPEPAQVYYNLGLCYRELDQPQDAAKAWQQCVQLAKGEEAQAAAIVLANLRLLEQNPAPALDILTRAVEKVRTPADWTNKLIDVSKAVSTFEKAAQVFREKGLYDAAMQLLDPYSKLAPPFKVVVLRADVAWDWARANFDKSRIQPSSPEEERLTQELFIKAAEGYAQAADAVGLSPADQGAYRWLSAKAYQSARDPLKAAEQLEKFVKLPVDAAKLGEAYYCLGEVHRNDKDEKAAGAAYQKCLEHETPFAYPARYQLAMAALRAGRVDDAEALLVKNLAQLSFERDLDALGQTLFALGTMLYDRRDYRGVLRHLENGLSKFKENKQFQDTAEVTQARYQLADSYRQLAAQENQTFLLGESMSEEARLHHQKEHRRLLQAAADEFASLDAFLESPAGKEQLTKDQRNQTPLITAKCWFNLGQYDKALKVYERAIKQYPDQIEGLDALGGAVSCHAAMGQIDKVRARLIEIKLLLPKMPTDIRIPWERWVELAIQPLKDLEGESGSAKPLSDPVLK